MAICGISGLILFVFIRIAAASCPREWKEFGGECFIFVNTQKTWYDAVEYCEIIGGHLAVVDNQDLNDFLSLRVSPSIKNDLWLDGTDEMKEGIWKWSSSQKRFGFANWHPTEPNGRKRENCIVGDTSMKPKLQWADVDCNSKRSLICQKKYSISDICKDGVSVVKYLLDELIKCKRQSLRNII